MDESRIVHSFSKNPEEEVRMALREYKDRRYLDLRLWYQPSTQGEYLPTKKGITLSVDFLGELKTGLEKVAGCLEMPLQTTPNSVK